MTINTTTATVSYDGDGISTVFPITFVFFGVDELEVVERDLATGAETDRHLTTDYTVTGGDGATGTATAVVAPPIGVRWTIARATKQTQEMVYTENDEFPAKSHEKALDRLTAMVQDVAAALGRTAKLSVTSLISSLTLPDPQPGLFLRGNNAADGYENADIAGTGMIGLPVPIAQGGTHAATASSARSNLGLATTDDIGFVAGAVVALDANGRMPAVDALNVANSGRLINTIYIGASTTYAKNPDAAYITVEYVGGGASGGGTPATSTGQAASAGGGGSGGWGTAKILSALLSATTTVTIGLGGAAPTAGGNPGNNGGTTSFGSFCSATGGVAGAAGSVSSGSGANSQGGGAGASTGGDINLAGGPGGAGLIFAGVSVAGGKGGTGHFGDGAIGSQNSAGANASNPGCGGAGGSAIASQAARAGGKGADGYMIIREYK